MIISRCSRTILLHSWETRQVTSLLIWTSTPHTLHPSHTPTPPTHSTPHTRPLHPSQHPSLQQGFHCSTTQPTQRMDSWELCWRHLYRHGKSLPLRPLHPLTAHSTVHTVSQEHVRHLLQQLRHSRSPSQQTKGKEERFWTATSGTLHTSHTPTPHPHTCSLTHAHSTPSHMLTHAHTTDMPRQQPGVVWANVSCLSNHSSSENNSIHSLTQGNYRDLVKILSVLVS